MRAPCSAETGAVGSGTYHLDSVGPFPTLPQTPGRDYRSHTALARHRKEKHLEWGEHESHSANEECSLQVIPRLMYLALRLAAASDSWEAEEGALSRAA